MNQLRIAAAAGITEQLQVNSDEEKKLLDTLHQQLSNALIDDNIPALKGIAFAHEGTDFFGVQPQEAPIEKSNTASVSAKPTHRVFVRDTPVRNAQLKTSVPSWAVGAKVDKTIGPFINKDGRRLWYDFYPIEELIALYVDGQPNPVLLFHISVFRRIF